MNKADLNTLEIAQATLLAPAGLDAVATQQVFGTILAHRVDDADLYFQYNRSEGWTLEEGQVKSGSFSIDQGVGVRVVAGEKTAFAYSDDINVEALDAAAKVTRAIAASGGDAAIKAPQVSPGRSLYAPIDPVAQYDDARKVRILETLEKYARAADPRVKQVIGRLSGEYDVVMVARVDGGMAADVRPLVHLAITVIAEQDGRREQGHQGGGGRFGYAHFTDELLEKMARDAVRQALINLEARPAPAGQMSVVLGPGWPGILLHEAIGHGLEGDFNRKGTSAFSGRIGERVAAPGVTVIDDGTISDRRGSLSIDDEGNPTQRNVLIEDGILRGYIQDRMNARLMNVPVTGNGRRES
ncbi:MAG: metallopeptidase TldD-related protein, partial [Usitatibacter sp.]